MTDIEIANTVKLKPITEIAKKLGIDPEVIELYGKYKAKLPLDLIQPARMQGKHLILVSAISPTPAGEGKTTISIGLTEGLNRIGKKTTVVLREPSLGPVFGIKGGATGGGYSQVLPMEDINLHFTGDFNAIEKAQEKIEFNNFGIRKNLLDYDQVNNEQREIIYEERRQVLDGENMRDAIYKMITDIVDSMTDMCFSDDMDSSEWDLNEFNTAITPIIPIHPLTAEKVKGHKKDEIKHIVKEEAVKLYEAKEAEFPEPEQLRELERVVLLKCIDSKWMDHIDDMEMLRQGIGLMAYGQRDPVEYKMNAFEMFNSMISSIQEDTVRMLYHVHVEQKIEREQVAKVTGTNKDDSAGPKKPVQRKEDKVYPNDPCPCGSGKKYKQCCGRKAAKI